MGLPQAPAVVTVRALQPAQLPAPPTATTMPGLELELVLVLGLVLVLVLALVPGLPPERQV